MYLLNCLIFFSDQRTENQPKTPDMRQKYSRRAFDGLVKIWRKQLHKYDPDCTEISDDQSQSSDDKSQNTDEPQLGDKNNDIV